MTPASPKAPRDGGRRAWSLLAALSLLLFLITASTFSSLGVVLPAMVGALDWTWEQAGLGFTLLGVFTGASSWLPALLIRRIGVRGAILIGSAVMCAGFACLAATDGLVLYFAGAALCGVGYQMAALIPGTHVLSSVFAKRALPFGIYFTFGALGGVAGPWMVLAVMGATDGDWRAYWTLQAWAAAGVGLACAALVGGRAWLLAAARATDAKVAQAAADPAPGGVHRTIEDWTVKEALRTPQFYVLLAAYFSHLLGGVTVASLSVAHLTQLGIAATAAAALLSLEALMQTAARLGGGLIGDRLDPRWLLVGSQAAMAAGLLALAAPGGPGLLLVYAVGTGAGFGLTVLAVTMLLLNYYGRKPNLELFSLTALVGALSALGPVIGGAMRDRLGGFGPTFQLFAAVVGLVGVAALFMRPPTRRGAAAR